MLRLIFLLLGGLGLFLFEIQLMVMGWRRQQAPRMGENIGVFYHQPFYGDVGRYPVYRSCTVLARPR